MSDALTEELLALNQRLLDSIERRDWEAYAALCDPTLTAHEPEAAGHCVAGMDFHRFYFDMEVTGRPSQSTISSPHVRLMNDVAVVTYVRLRQVVDTDGSAPTRVSAETRVWQRQNGEWRHVHFHRS